MTEEDKQETADTEPRGLVSVNMMTLNLWDKSTANLEICRIQSNFSVYKSHCGVRDRKGQSVGKVKLKNL